MMNGSYLYDGVRTVFGRFNGGLKDVRPDDLAAQVIGAMMARSPRLDPTQIDDVVFGNANGAGEENRNVGRMAALLAGLPVSITGTTVNRLCGSSLDAAMIASRQIEVGDADVILVGGVESMTRAPWVLPKPAKPYPAGNQMLASTTLGWRLINPRMPAEWTISLGESNELLAEREGISRQRQDEFAAESHRKAHEAWESGFYDDHVMTVPGATPTRDENIRPGSSPVVLAALTPSFRPDGTITAGNASPLTDGACAAIMGGASAAGIFGRDPLARIAGRGAYGLDPRYFGFAPVEAANRALTKAGIDWDQVGAVELNEAFAVQSLACLDAWKIDPAIVNIHGGALAIGHPLGASGARLLITLAKTLRHTNQRWGVAALCIGVGQGLAIVIENVDAH